MCGIVGLFLKDPALEPQLGSLTETMLATLSDRGPDSAGFAVYGEGRSGETKLTLRGPSAAAMADIAEHIRRAFSEVQVELFDTHAVVSIADQSVAPFEEWLTRHAPAVDIVGRGKRMALFKEVGLPEKVAERFGLGAMKGTHAIGHTRMATESAVTTAHSHPFAPAADLALVHNGSFSNYATVRRRLARSGIHCATDNDSEVAARLVASRMALGEGLDDALRRVMKEMDGFFTLLVSTATQFAVVRDSFACKPAVIAQTEDYVAMASEYQALTSLPGIADAEVFEPVPEEIYIWNRRS